MLYCRPNSASDFGTFLSQFGEPLNELPFGTALLVFHLLCEAGIVFLVHLTPISYYLKPSIQQ